MERRYTVDVVKLQAALENKRRSNHHTWLLISHRLGIAATTLKQLARIRRNGNNKGIDGNILVGVLMYIGQPLSNFIVEHKKEVVNDAYSQQDGSLENSSESPTGLG